MPTTYPLYTHNVSTIYQQYAHIYPHIPPIYPQLPTIYPHFPTYIHNIPTIIHIIPTIYPPHTHHIPPICPQYIHNMPTIGGPTLGLSELGPVPRSLAPELRPQSIPTYTHNIH